MEGRTGELVLLRKRPVLNSESTDEFDAIYEALEREIKPRGPIERMYTDDISVILWEILRLRRCKTAIINAAYRAALECLLKQFLKLPDQPDYAVREEAERRAARWFTDQTAKDEVTELLARFGLDDSAIEAEAVRRCAADLERLDRLITSLESRRNKALRCIGEYRDGFARRLRESADKIIDAQAVPRLEDASTRQSTAA